MAPPAARIHRQDGAAILEATAVSSLLVSLVLGIFLAAYIIFARVWLDYQSENALLCRAQGRLGCIGRFQTHVHQFLPWGELTVLGIHEQEAEWRIKGSWQFNGITLPVSQKLHIDHSFKRPALHW